ATYTLDNVDASGQIVAVFGPVESQPATAARTGGIPPALWWGMGGGAAVLAALTLFLLLRKR
ncbi:MAG: hypothetical protein PHO66_08010, partial [Eubacteriales bacterium]|nr:hypothetical protein [Eubacteriales bacterium]